MLTEKMQMAIEYRDMLLEILDLEDRIFGADDEPVLDPKESITPEEKKPEKKPVKKQINIDKGRILALARAGWKKKDIAKDAKCSEATVYAVLKEASAQNVKNS